MTWTTRQRSRSGPLALIEAGKGPDVVLIHGVGLRAEAWGAQIDALASHFRCRAFDLPGHGESDLLAPGADLKSYSAAIAREIGDASFIIGHSMGAMVALDIACRYPEKVAGVAALNAIFQRSAEAAQAVRARAETLQCNGPADPEPTLIRWFGSEPSAERAACDNWLRTVDRQGYARAYSIFAREDGPDAAALQELACPALFLTGAEEPNSTPAMSHAMAALCPKGVDHIIGDAAHMLPMTHPAEVNAHLLAFARHCHPPDRS